MPSRTAFPRDDEIGAFVASCGVALPSGFAFQGYGAQAQIEFQTRTNRIPFLKDSDDVMRSYDPPGPTHSGGASWVYHGGLRKLYMDAGILDVTSVYVGVTPDNVGTSMDLARQVRFLPANAPAIGIPYEAVEFFFPIYGGPGSIQITGKWGFAAEIPEDAWQAALRIGAGLAARDILQGIYASPTTIKTADEETQQDSFRDLGTAWEEFAARVIFRYRMLEL